MIEPANPDFAISKDCKPRSIVRSSFYNEPKCESEMDLALMRGLRVDRPNQVPLSSFLRKRLPGNGSASSWSECARG